MNNNVNKIMEALKDKPELQSKFLYHKTYEEVLEILLLRETCNPKFRYLFTANIWRTYPKNIKLILNMPEWDNPKYEHLLTPSIWQCSYKDINDILNLKEWKLKRFKHLLTPSIWTSRPEQISSKLQLPYFKMPKYQHLLTPGIFVITEKNINDNILLFEEYGITKFIMPNNIRINANDQRLLIEYMIDNNIPLVVRGKLNEILCSTTTKKLATKGIDLNLLREVNKDKTLAKVK